jgi:hypothetical protein
MERVWAMVGRPAKVLRLSELVDTKSSSPAVQRLADAIETVAGETIDAESLPDAVAMVPPGTIYLPAECATKSGRFGDLYVSVPAGREWATREHGGSDTYVVRASS